MKKSIRKMVMLLGACTLLYSCSEDSVRDSLRENKAVSTSAESFLSKN